MGLHYENLDYVTRLLMARNCNSGATISARGSPRRASWPGPSCWPRRSTTATTTTGWRPNWSAAGWCGRPRRTSGARSSTPATSTRPTPPSSSAEGEFNRYYLRGLCLRAVNEGVPFLVVYRGKDVDQPRPESQAKVGARVPVDALLETLRRNDFVTVEDAVGGVPGGPNSGLTCRLPTAEELASGPPEDGSARPA